jgi:hypothetical protein
MFMTPDNDHDTLIRIETMLNIMMQQQAEFYKNYDIKHAELVGRVVQLEVKQAANITQIEINSDEVAALRKVNNIWNFANSVAVGIAGILGIRQ